MSRATLSLSDEEGEEGEEGEETEGEESAEAKLKIQVKQILKNKSKFYSIELYKVKSLYL